MRHSGIRRDLNFTFSTTTKKVPYGVLFLSDTEIERGERVRVMEGTAQRTNRNSLRRSRLNPATNGTHPDEVEAPEAMRRRSPLTACTPKAG